MKPIILPELIDIGRFYWRHPLKTTRHMRRALKKRKRNLRRPESCWMNISAPPPSPSLSKGIPWQSSWKEERPAMLPSCRNPSWNGCLICSWDCWILHTMLAAYDALLFCLNKKKKATHVKRPLLTFFSASLVISGALPATEGTPVAFLLLHPCSHYDWSHSVLICVDSHVFEGSCIDEQKISQRLFSVAILFTPSVGLVA